MAISDQQIFDWFKANPTADDATIASTMDQFKVNPTDVARATGTNVADIQSRYNAVQPTGGLNSLSADNINPTGGYTKSAVQPTSGGVSNVVEGDNIEQQISQLPEEIAHWARSADQRTMELINDKTGNVLDRRAVGDFSDLDMVKMGLSMVPGAGQILGAVNVADALRTGNLANAAIGATGLAGMNNLNTALRVGQAANTGNTFGALTALAGNSDLQKLVGVNDVNVGGITPKDAITANNLLKAAQSGQLGPAAFNQAMSLINSNLGGSGSTSGTATSNVAKTAPLSEADQADLTPDQLAVYKDQGTQGLIDYNRALKNMTSLTGVEGYDYSGDVGNYDTTGATNTASTADTGATTNTDFVNSEYTRLQALGYTKEQISDYFDKLDALTSNLDTTESTGTVGSSADAGKLEVVGNKVADETLNNLDTSNTKNLGTVTVTGGRPDTDVAGGDTNTKVVDNGEITVVGDRPTDIKTTDSDTVTITGDRPTTVVDTGVTTIPSVVTHPVVKTPTVASSRPTTTTSTSTPLQQPKLSYKKVYEETPFLNPLLFSLAGVPIPPQDKKENILSSDIEEEKIKKEEEDKQQEAPALDLINFFSFAEGGLVPQHPMGEPEFYSEGGAGTTYIEGRGDGTSDQIPAMVANNEFVIPADVVSALGNGSSDSGASVLDQFIETIRAHKHSNPPSKLPPESKGPLEYLSNVLTKGKR